MPVALLVLVSEAMFGWPIMFLIIAVVAAVFGFGGIVVASAGIAKFLFYVFLMFFLVSLFLALSHHT